MAFLLSLWPSLGKAPEGCPCLKSQDIKVYKAHCPKKEFKSRAAAKLLPTQLPNTGCGPCVYFSQLNAHKKGLHAVARTGQRAARKRPGAPINPAPGPLPGAAVKGLFPFLWPRPAANTNCQNQPDNRLLSNNCPAAWPARAGSCLHQTMRPQPHGAQSRGSQTGCGGYRGRRAPGPAPQGR